MTFASPILFAAEGASRVLFELGRIQSNTDWILPVGACVVILVFVRWMYIRDARELSLGVRWLLTLLRTAAFLGLLILYLDPSWRTERDVTHPSRALVMVDTSLSMGLTDVASAGSSGAVSRLQQVAEGLDAGNFLNELRKVHNVEVWRFDQELKRIAPLDKLRPEGEAKEGQPDEPAADGTEGESGKADVEKPKPIKWTEVLQPVGNETRLGQSLRQLLLDERSAPLSGVIVIGDGGQNAGVTPDAAVELAREAKVPVMTVGVGSDKKLVNVRVSDLAVPARAYPGDRFTVTGYLQAQGMAKQTVTVELLSREAAGGPATAPGTGQLETSQQVILGTDGEVVPVKFELTPEETGRRTLCLRVQVSKADRDRTDNFREADVEIVDRKNRVLLVAGGPTREYRFLRTLLYRDKSTTVDVLLQTARPGISQEADAILDDFPMTREEMFEYDCVVAFDPDWQEIGPEGVELLETWVAEQGGGLVLIAGPVFTGKVINGWVQDPAMGKIRALYPVEFISRITVDETSYVADEPWPLDFTRAGLEADYLRLGDSVGASELAWSEFKGVFSHFPVRGAKPAATVLARFGDPRSGQGKDQAPYFVSQFYGSGRVFFAGSGEMWRIRAADDTYFEQFYTKLIRHVSQGRLLRGSSRGVLLVGQDRYLLGNTVEVRAQLTNAQLHPLEVDRVPVQIIHQESGSVQTLSLSPDPTRLGTFSGQFTAMKEGTYRLELPVPESDDERLVQTIKVRIPKLESETPERNDVLLANLAKNTGGVYYLGLTEAVEGTPQKQPISALLRDRTRTSVLVEAPNPLWKERWLRWIMYLICGVLLLEWLIRRLMKLA